MLFTDSKSWVDFLEQLKTEDSLNKPIEPEKIREYKNNVIIQNKIIKETEFSISMVVMSSLLIVRWRISSALI